jgi:hypothetical protein
MKLQTTVLSRAINEDDGSLSLFVSVAELNGVELEPPSATEPELNIVRCEFHFKDDKPHTLEIRVGTWGNTPSDGEPITLFFD